MREIKELRYDDVRLMSGITGGTEYSNGRYMKEVIMVEIDNPYSSTGKRAVRALCVDEAKALISREYGFEYNAIRIRGVCWYGAADYNYFRFAVGGWEYEAENFGALRVVGQEGVTHSVD